MTSRDYFQVYDALTAYHLVLCLIIGYTMPIIAVIFLAVIAGSAYILVGQMVLRKAFAAQSAERALDKADTVHYV